MTKSTESSKQLICDAWPLMEWVRGREPAKSMIRELFRRVHHAQGVVYLSRMNLGEVYYITTRDYGETKALAFLQILRDVPLQIVSVSDEQVDSASRLKARYRLSYADAFAAALAMERDLPLATGDRDFLELERQGVLRVHWMGA